MQSIIEYSDYKEWFNKIIYAPNSTGKTRLAYNIFNKYINDNKLIFTSKEIDNLLKISLSKKKIYIGLTAPKSLENDLIIENYKKNTNYKNMIKEYWNVSSAKELKNKSAYFNYLNVTSITFDKYFLSIIDNKDIQDKYNIEMNLFDVIEYDKKLDIEMFNEIKKYVFNDTLDKMLILKENDNTITSDELSILNNVRDLIITKNLSECPICGQEFLNNDDLLVNVNDCLSKLIINDKPDVENKIFSLWRKLNRKYNGKIYTISFDISHIVIDLINYYNLCLKIFNELNKNIILYSFEKESEFINSKFKYEINKRDILEEDKKFESNTKIYDDIELEFYKLISLPSNCTLEVDNNDFVILLDNKKIEIANILSESEKKRFALIILKSYIENFNVELVILDDPVDSYDDYYREEASNYITEIIKNNSGIKWVILTHMYDFIISFSKKIKDGFKLIAYFYDPTYKIKSKEEIGNKTPLIKKCISIKDSLYDGEEIIMINNLLNSKSNTNDSLFVLLSTFSIVRSLIKEVNCIIDISYKKSKVVRQTNLLESNYLHYSGVDIKTKIILELYKKIFKSFKGSLIMSEYINQDRNKYLSMKYERIKINNQFIKYILYMLFKIESLKYIFEEKIYKLIQDNNVKKEYLDGFINTHTLGKKIKYVKKYKLIDSAKIDEIESIFNKYNTIINDYSHSYSRLYAPYLSANMKDVAMFEYSIENI